MTIHFEQGAREREREKKKEKETLFESIGLQNYVI